MTKHTLATKGATEPPAALSAEWVYDTLMQEIEPDLTTGSIRTLDTKYAGESPEEREIRMERYTLAFEVFEQALVEVLMVLEIDAEAFGREMTMMARDILKDQIDHST